MADHHLRANEELVQEDVILLDDPDFRKRRASGTADEEFLGNDKRSSWWASSEQLL